MNSLPESPTGQQLRDEGQADVIAADTAVHRMAAEHMRRVFRELIVEGRPFSTDDVHERLPEDVKPHSHNLWGSVTAEFRNRKLMTAVGAKNSKRTEARYRLIRVWQAVRTVEAAA